MIKNYLLLTTIIFFSYHIHGMVDRSTAQQVFEIFKREAPKHVAEVLVDENPTITRRQLLEHYRPIISNWKERLTFVDDIYKSMGHIHCQEAIKIMHQEKTEPKGNNLALLFFAMLHVSSKDMGPSILKNIQNYRTQASVKNFLNLICIKIHENDPAPNNQHFSLYSYQGGCFLSIKTKKGLRHFLYNTTPEIYTSISGLKLFEDLEAQALNALNIQESCHPPRNNVSESSDCLSQKFKELALHDLQNAHMNFYANKQEFLNDIATFIAQ